MAHVTRQCRAEQTWLLKWNRAHSYTTILLSIRAFVEIDVTVEPKVRLKTLLALSLKFQLVRGNVDADFHVGFLFVHIRFKDETDVVNEIYV